MIFEWIRFAFVALFFLAGIVTLYISIFGTFKFKFALNRIHSAAMNDTLVLILFLLGCAVWAGFGTLTAKYILIIAVQWCASPVTSHMLAKMEYMTDNDLDEYCELDDQLESED